MTLKAWAWFDRKGRLIPETFSTTYKEALGESLYHDEPGDYLLALEISHKKPYKKLKVKL